MTGLTEEPALQRGVFYLTMATKNQKRAVKAVTSVKSPFHFVGKDGKRYKLTPRQRRFCHHYLEFKGSGLDAVVEAGYRAKSRRVAAAMAARELTKVNICAYLTLKLEEHGYHDDEITKQHLFLINQFANLHAKARAIDMFYKRRRLYSPARIQVEDGRYDELTDEELFEKRARLDKRVKEIRAELKRKARRLK